MKEEPPYNPYTFDPYEPHPRDLESAIGRFLGFLFGLGIGHHHLRNHLNLHGMKDDDYNPTSHTLTILMVLAVCLAVILFLLCSCKTVHEVEHVTTHDTLYVHNSDTVREVKVTHHTDTVKQIEKHTYTINNVGDTIKEIHHYHDVQHTIIVDSTERYEAKVDSLEKALAIEKSKEKVVEKRLSFWAHLKDYAIGGVITLIALGVIWWGRKEIKRKR